LFALDQELHRTLVDGAIGGLDLAQLTSLAARRAARQVVVDRDGDVIAGRPYETVPAGVLERVRGSIQAHDSLPTLVPGEPSALVAPIATGRERYGLSLIYGAESGLTDDHEVILVSLASAAAIVLGREPEAGPETVNQVLRSLASLRDPESKSWTALALSDLSSGLRRLQRVARAELAARDLDGFVASEGDSLVVLIPGAEQALATSVIRSLRARTGSLVLRAGLGRGQSGAAGARRSSDQALAALGYADPGQTMLFEQIEIAVLLQGEPGWLEFATAQLGPLLGTRPDERELLHSLRTYLSCGRNAKAAARRLQVHRNTLQYRLRRIETLLGRALDDTEVLFSLDLACRILEAHENRR